MLFKILLAGPACVGKSAMFSYWKQHPPVFPENYIPTVGVDFIGVFVYDVARRFKVKLQTWDTS